MQVLGWVSVNLSPVHLPSQPPWFLPSAPLPPGQPLLCGRPRDGAGPAGHFHLPVLLQRGVSWILVEEHAVLFRKECAALRLLQRPVGGQSSDVACQAVIVPSLLSLE